MGNTECCVGQRERVSNLSSRFQSKVSEHYTTVKDKATEKLQQIQIEKFKKEYLRLLVDRNKLSLASGDSTPSSGTSPN